MSRVNRIVLTKLFVVALGLWVMMCGAAAHAVVLLSQDFDTDPVNYTNSPFVVGTSDKTDYWALSGTLGMTLNPNLTGASGVYLTGQDMDGGGGLAFSSGAPAYIDFAVSTTNFTDLKLSVALAGSPMAEDVNFVRAFTDNDGNGSYETPVFNFRGAGNSAYTDTNLGALSTTFSTFSGIALSSPTSVDGLLRLRFEVFNDTASLNENVGIDNIVISGTSLGGPVSSAASGSWHTAAAWNPAAVPIPGDTVTVNTHAITVTTAAAVCKTLAITNNGSITVTGQPLTIGDSAAEALDTKGGTLSLGAGATLNIANANASTSFKKLAVAAGAAVNVSSELTVDGPLTLSGATLTTPKITLAGGTLTKSDGLSVTGTLTGSGAIVGGTVSVASGAHVVPGSTTSVATITTSALSLAGGSILDFNFGAGNNDKIANSSLTLNGGGFHLYAEGDTTTFSTLGTYNLIGYSGTIGGSGISSLSVLNKVVGKSYTFGAAGGFVTLTIGQGGWNGAGGDANWATSANWSGGPPGPGDVVIFVTAGAGGTTLNNNLGSGPFASLQFESGAPAFTLNGGSVTLNGDSNGAVLVNYSTKKQTVNLPIALGSSGTINTASGDVAVGGVISGSSGLTKQGGGNLLISAATTYTGDTRIAEGTLTVGHQNALAATTVDMNAADAGTLSFGAPAVTLGGLKGSRNLDLGAATVSIGANNANSSYSGNLSGGTGLTKIGTGTLSLQAENAYSGTTTINGGTLKLSGFQAPPGAALWLDATDTAHIVKDASNLVSQWQDRAGGTDKLTQTDATRQPTYVASGINGLPVVHFSTSGTADYINTATDFRGQPFTIFSVSRLTGGTNARLISSNGNNWLLGYHGNYVDRFYFEGWVYGEPGVSAADTRAHMYEATIPGTGQNSTVWVYDDRNPAIRQLASNQTGVTAPQGFQLGGYNGANENSDGDVGEVLIYRKVLSAAEQAAAENYLIAKWFGGGVSFNNIPDTSPVSIGASGSLDVNDTAETIGPLSGGGSVNLGTLGLGKLTVNSTAGNDTTYSGVISGAGTLVKTGPATLTLSGANTFAGDTRIADGTLTIGNPLALAGSTLDMNAADAGTLDLNGRDATLGGLKGTRGITLATGKTLTMGGNNQTTAYSGILTGNAAVTKLGTGTSALTGANAYSGATTITDGAVNVGNGSGLPANSLLVFNGTGSQMPVVEMSGTFSRAIGAAAGNVQWTGHGGFAAKGGPLAVQLNGGTATIDWTATIGDGRNLILNSTTADNVAEVQNGISLGAINREIAVKDNTGSTADLGKISGAISGAGGIIKTGPGTLNLAGTNSFNGGVTINAGVLQLGSAGALNAATPNAVAFAANGSGKLQLNGNSVTVSGLSSADPGQPGSSAVENASATPAMLTVNKAAGLSDTFAGVLQDGIGGGKLSLTKAGPGRLDLSGANTLTGQLNVTGGTLGGTATSLAANVVLSNNANVTFSQASDDRFKKTISGTGSLTKDGAGTLTVLFAQTYNGPTVISSGTLKLTPMVLTPGINASIFDATPYGYELLDIDGATYTYPTTRCFSGSTRLLALTPTSSAVKYMGQVSGFGMFAGLPADKHATGFSGTIVPPVTGSYNFRWSDDDRGHMYIDMDNNGVFEAGEAVAANAWDANGNKTLNAGQFYNFIYMSMDGGGGESNNFYVTIPGKGEEYVNPGSANQTGMWNQLELGTLNNTLPTTTAVSVAGGATFDLGGVTQTIGSLSDYNGSGGSVKLGGATLTVDTVNDSSFSGVISGNGGLIKTGLGTQTLKGAGAQTYVGPTKVLGGTLALDFSSLPTPTDMIPSTSALTMAGGTLSINGKADPASGTSQTFPSLTLNAGAAAVRVTNNGLAANVALGTVVRNPGATVAFTLPSAGHIFGSSANFFANAVLLDANGAAFATAGSSDWAAMDGSGSEIVTGTAAGVYTLASGAGGNFGDAQSIDMDVSTELTVAGVPDSIRFNLASASNLNLKGNDLSVGGILVTPGMGAQATTISGAGKLRGRNATADLVLIQNNTSAPLVINSVIADPIAGVTKSGPGDLVLGGANTFTGPLVINGGKVTFTSAGASGTYPIVFGAGSSGLLQLLGQPLTVLGLGGDLTGPGSAVVENFSTTAAALTINNSTNFAYGGVLRDGAGSAPMSLVKNGGGTQILAGNNTFTGGVTLNAGVLQLGSAGALNASAPNAVTFGPTSTGTLRLAGNSITVPALSTDSTVATVENASASPATLTTTIPAGTSTFAGVLQDGTGGGALALSKTGPGTLVLGGSNSFSGGVTIDAGNVRLANPQALNSATPGPLTFTANSTSVLQLNGNSVTLGGLIVDPTNPGSPVVENANATAANLTVNQPAGVVVTFPGLLRDGTGGGALGFTKGGAGTLNLTGANAFSGAVAINGGTLGVGSDSALGTGAGTITVTGGPTIQALGAARSIANPMEGTGMTVGGTNNMTFAGPFTLTDSGTLAAATTGTTTFSNAITVADTKNLTLARSAGAGALTVDNVRFQGAVAGNPRSPWTNTLFVTSAPGVVVKSLGAGPGVLDNGSIDLQNGNTLRIAGPNHLGGFMVLGTDGNTGADASQLGTTLEIASDDAFGTASTVFARNIVGSAVPWDQAVYVWNGVIKAVGGPRTLSNRNLTMRINIAFTGDDLTFTGPGFVRSQGAHTLFVYNTTTFANGVFEQNAGQSIIKDGPGTLVIGGASSSYTWTADGVTYGPFSTYTSGTTVNAGTLRWTTAFAKPASGTVTVASGGKLVVNAGGTDEFSDVDLSSLIGSATFNAGAVLGIDTANATGGFESSSTIMGNLTLAKLGPNTLTLSGINSYTGGTTVNAGTLQVGSAEALPGGGSLTIGAGSTVVLSSGLSAGAGSAGAAAPVPEPGTLVLLGAGALAGVLLCLRRRVK